MGIVIPKIYCDRSQNMNLGYAKTSRIVDPKRPRSSILETIRVSGRCITLFFLLFVSHLYAYPEKTSSIQVVYHIATLNNWEEVVQEQLETFHLSGLGDACDCLTVTVVGPHIQKVNQLIQLFPFYPKTRIVHASEDVRLCEFPGIEMVKHIAQEQSDANILYMHSKGVTHQKDDRSRNVRSWRRYLEHFVIERWRECIEALQSYNICGVEWLNCTKTLVAQVELPGFFAGNFWWARADYLRTCQEVPARPWDPQWLFQHRYDCEVFITTGANPTPKSFHQSGVNLYEFNYTPEYYMQDLHPQKNAIELVYHIVASQDRIPFVEEQLQLMQKVGFAEACDRITVLVLGPEISKIINLFKNTPIYEKTRIIHANSQLYPGEFPAFEMIKKISSANPSAKICYIHNLGETYLKPPPQKYKSIQQALYRTWVQKKKEITTSVKTWFQRFFFRANTKQSTHLVIQEWEKCINELQSSSLCGITWKKGIPRKAHFPDITCSGYFENNCWWARADYLNTCRDVHYRSSFHIYHDHWKPAWFRQYYLDCRMFIGTGEHPLVKDLHYEK